MKNDYFTTGRIRQNMQRKQTDTYLLRPGGHIQPPTSQEVTVTDITLYADRDFYSHSYAQRPGSTYKKK